MPSQSYDELFDQRGGAYDRAMRRFPEARREEFSQLLERAEVESGMSVADVPAGGAYLAPYLPEGCEWLSHEPCGDFTAHAGQERSGSVPLLPLPWPDDRVDVADIGDRSSAGGRHRHAVEFDDGRGVE